MLTQPRVLGYVFNPVTFYWCYRADGSLACIVAELNNTFGERLPEVLRGPGAALRAREAAPRLAVLRARLARTSTRSRSRASEVWARMHVRDGAGRKPLTAVLHGERRELTNALGRGAAPALPAAAGAGDGADPLAGAAPVAEARAVPPQAAVRAGRGVSAAVTRAARAPAAARGRAARAPPRRAVLERALAQLEGGTLEVRAARRRACGASAPARPSASRSTTRAFFRRHRDPRQARLRRVVHRRRVGHRRPRRPLRAAPAQRRRRGRAPRDASRRLLELRPRLARAQRLRAPARNIAYHYDLGNDLFELMLDETMTYSCAVFEEPGDDARRRAAREVRRVCDKLAARPGRPRARDRLRLGRVRADRGRRVRLPRHRPHDLARAGRRSPASASPRRGSPTGSRSSSRTTATLEGAVHEGRLDRDARGDRRGAVRRRTSRRSTACSRRGGRAAIQAILVPDQRCERYRRTPDWIERYVFPGCLIPSLEALTRAAAQHSRLGIYGVDEIGAALRRDARGVARERPRAHRGGARGSATTGGSSGRGTSTSPSARRRSARALCATCSSSSRGPGASGERRTASARPARRPRRPSAALPGRGRRCRADPGERAGDPRREPRVDLGPVAPRDRDAARDPLHGEGRALPEPRARRGDARVQRVPGRARRRRPRRDVGEAGGSSPRGEVLGHVPAGDVEARAAIGWHRGAARLALATGAPVVPVRLRGTRPIPRRSRVHITVTDPIVVPVARPTIAAAKELTERIEQAVMSA